MKRKRAPLPPWSPFERASFGGEREQDDRRFLGVFLNSRYQVSITETETPLGVVLWLSIVNRDRSARHDWRDFQRLKNELVGPEREAIEVYPAESRLVDTNNQYHLFVMPEGAVIPVGYLERDVGVKQRPGSAHRQRPFEVPPADLDSRLHAGPTALIAGGPQKVS